MTDKLATQAGRRSFVPADLSEKYGEVKELVRSTETIEEALVQPTLAQMSKDQESRVMTLKLLGEITAAGMLYFGDKALTVEEQGLWCAGMINQYPHESAGDLSVFFRGASFGAFSDPNDFKFIKKLSIPVLNDMWQVYLNKKAEKRETMHKDKDVVHPDIATKVKEGIEQRRRDADQAEIDMAAEFQRQMRILNKHGDTMTREDGIKRWQDTKVLSGDYRNKVQDKLKALSLKNKWSEGESNNAHNNQARPSLGGSPRND